MNVWGRIEAYLNRYWPLVMGELALLSDEGWEGLKGVRDPYHLPEWLKWVDTIK